MEKEKLFALVSYSLRVANTTGTAEEQWMVVNGEEEGRENVSRASFEIPWQMNEQIRVANRASGMKIIIINEMLVIDHDICHLSALTPHDQNNFKIEMKSNNESSSKIQEKP